MATKGISIRLEQETIDLVKQIAEITERDPAFIMRKAIETYTEHESWVVQETMQRLDKLKKGKAKLTNHENVKGKFQL